MEKLLSIQTDAGNKQLRVWDKSSHFNSDQKNYPLGVGIAAMHKRKFVGFCCGRIHTKRDTILEEENVNILRDQLLKFLAG